MATEQQIQEMNQRLMKLGQMLQESRDREAALEARLQGVEMAGQSIGPATQALATSQTEVANALKRDEKKTMTLIDSRGVGKPEKYTGKDNESFLRWKITLGTIHLFIFPRVGKGFDMGRSPRFHCDYGSGPCRFRHRHGRASG